MRAREALPDRLNARPSLWAAAALAAAGLVLAASLARIHATAHAGLASFCTLSEYVDCDRVATSRFSVALGLPVAVWGLLGYWLALQLALAGLRSRRRVFVPLLVLAPLAELLALAGLFSRRRSGGFPSGLLFLVGAAAFLTAIGLALVSELLVGALCLLCAGTWLVSTALLFAAWRSCKPEGVASAVRRDLGVLRERPLVSSAVAVGAIAAVVVLASAYPRYWQARASAGPALPERGAVPLPKGPLVVVEFSDYECPFCATAHEDAKAVLAARPNVTLVRRHFPLDSSCNRALKASKHPGACDLARAGICAEEQGRLPQMDDALFQNQKAKRPVEELARSAGLDLPRFRSCLSAHSTEERLRSDIEAAMRIGLAATPTYVIQGRPYSGKLPVNLLPPPAARPGLPGTDR